MAPTTINALVALYLIAVNAAAYLAFFHDKRRAISGGWRLREDTLLMLAFIGGWPSAKLAQRLFRHKTRKQPFAARLNRIVVFHLVVAGMLALPAPRHAIAQGIAAMAAPVIAAAVPPPRPDAGTRIEHPRPRRFGPGSHENMARSMP